MNVILCSFFKMPRARKYENAKGRFCLGLGCLCGVVVLGSSFRAREQELLALDRGMRVCDYIIMYIILGEKGEC